MMDGLQCPVGFLLLKLYVDWHDRKGRLKMPSENAERAFRRPFGLERIYKTAKAAS